MPYTLEDLLAPTTADDERAALRDAITGAGVPLPPTRINAVNLLVDRMAQSFAALRDQIAAIASGGLLELAERMDEPLWLTLLAESHYRLGRTAAQAAVVSVRLTAGAAGPYAIAPGTALLATATGLRYTSTNAAPLTLLAGGTLDLQFQAESPGPDYNLLPSATLALVQALPGVTATPLPVIGATSCSRAGQPAVTGSGTPSARSNFFVLVTLGGARGTATVSISTDGGATFVVSNLLTAATLGPYNGVTLNLDVGTYAAGAVYRFLADTAPVVLPGAAEESNAQLAQRCRDRWALLSGGRWTIQGLAALARTAAPGLLTSVAVDATNPRGPGTADVYLAQLGGPASAGVVSLAQEGLSLNAEINSDFLARASGSTTVAVHATVYCTSGTTAAVQTEFRKRFNAVQAALTINGTVQLADLIERMRSIPGVKNVNISSPSTDVTASGFALPVLTFAASGGVPDGSSSWSLGYINFFEV